MSTDLHLHHELPKLRIAAAKIDDDDVDVVPSPDQDHDVSSAVTRAENESDGAVAEAVADEDLSYRTPTSKESRIPAIMTCPPAPRKPKPFVSCKRKLLDFFEVTNKEDMDAFFRSTFPKRSCPCT